MNGLSELVFPNCFSKYAIYCEKLIRITSVIFKINNILRKKKRFYF